MAVPLISISIIFFIFMIFFTYKLYQQLKYKLPPGPCPWPIIGNLHNMEADRTLCFERWSQTYGPIISVWFGSTLEVIVSTTGLAKEVLKDKDQQLAHRHRTRPTAMVTKNGNDLIWADYGPCYVKLRKICALELFSPKSIETLRPIREDEVRAMIESIFMDCTSHGKSLLLRKYLGSLTLNNITRMVFGKQFLTKEGTIDDQGLEFKAIVASELKVGASLGLVGHIWWLNWIFGLTKKAIFKHLARRNRLIRDFIEEHKVQNKENGGTMHHFVDTLVSLQEKGDISEDTMIGLLWDIIIAGMDTITVVCEWAMAQLVKNPRVQHKVQEELDHVIGLNRAMTESDISSLPYLQCVVKEALRLHPPTPLMLPHKASTKIKLGGYDIPKGTIVHVNVRAIARDPKMWRNPLEFWPERFLEEDVDIKGNDFRLIPFGAGRRICPAVQLSINLVASMIGNLLHHFSWSLPDGVQPEEIDMSGIPAVVNYMKTPLQVVPTARLPVHLYQHRSRTMSV